ncbi:hypothetical protein CW751_11000 [Brumimicrobium salinarum]|uniref:Uncharacterized protein n=1 Tax=Brumimicrobium salinarum TaxID=2058658 RepID=A0A2I0R0T3_9FLAO|nr:hypothetical protein [Brumimicrobium salinarum]PKR80183.1 hypothetical protein CW751_11000 [Brumimicrobium salinarum]
MKYLIIIISTFLIIQSVSAQNEQELDLENVLVVAQQDDLSDRYTLEVALLELFNRYGINTKASLNVIKQGGAANILQADSTVQKLKSEGIDTYLLVSIRGYNKRFKPSEEINDFDEEIKAGHLYPLYRESASNVTFTFTFYRNLAPVHYELIRTGTVGSKDAVMKKLMKKVERKLRKDWIK